MLLSRVFVLVDLVGGGGTMPLAAHRHTRPPARSELAVGWEREGLEAVVVVRGGMVWLLYLNPPELIISKWIHALKLLVFLQTLLFGAILGEGLGE